MQNAVLQVNYSQYPIMHRRGISSNNMSKSRCTINSREYTVLCTWWWVCAWILVWKQFIEHRSSVVVDDAQMLVLACTENTQWTREYACSEYMQAMVKGTCILQVCHKRKTLECTMICAHDVEYAHEYMHGNNSWNISRSVVVDDAHYVGDCMHWQYGVKHEQACTENMEWIHEHACSEYIQAMANV